MHQWNFNKQLLGITIRKSVPLVVPFCSFEEEAIDVATILWSFFDVLMGHVVQNAILEADSVNGSVMLSRIVLERTSQEGLGEEES